MWAGPFAYTLRALAQYSIPILWHPDNVIFTMPDRVGQLFESAHVLFLSFGCGDNTNQGCHGQILSAELFL